MPTLQQIELTQRLKDTQPGGIIAKSDFSIIDCNENKADFENATILCRKRHSTKNPSKIIRANDYRFEIFNDDNNHCLGQGSFGSVFPITATLKLTEQGEIEILKKAKQRVVKLERPNQSGKIDSLAENEAQFGMLIKDLSMKPAIAGMNQGNAQVIHYLVMRKLSGMTLYQLLTKTDFSLTLNQKFLLLLSLLKALQDLHQLGLVHRDIKPENIIVDLGAENSKPQVHIIDFGFCKYQHQTDDSVCGTRDYIAPEAHSGNSCQASDIFSLGKTLENIDDYLKISYPSLEQPRTERLITKTRPFIMEMTAADSKQRISLKNAIVRLQISYICLKAPEKLAYLQLSLLNILSVNQSYATAIKKTGISYTKNDPNSIPLDEIFKINRLDLISVFNLFKESSHAQLAEQLIDAFELAVDDLTMEIAKPSASQLTNYRQAIMLAIFKYVQKTYLAASNDRAASQRRIENIQDLLTILRNTQNPQTLQNAISDWNKTIKRGWLGRSQLYTLVANAANLKNSSTPSLFWSKPSANPHLNNSHEMCITRCNFNS